MTAGSPSERRTTCARCVIHSDVPGVSFDDDGVCSYCHLHKVLEAQWPTGAEGRRMLDAQVERIKSQGKGRRYDCVVGVSGGTDSTYLLYLARQLGLRPLAAHFDNGWNSETAVGNIKQALTRLDVDLQTYVVDWDEFRDILLAFLRASFPWADAPTDLAIDATLYRVAAAEGVRTILNGSSFRTEGKMPAEWTYMDGRSARAIHRRFGTMKMSSFPNLTLPRFGYYAFWKRIHTLRPLNFIDYRKDEAREVLQRELGWRYYGGHHHESIYTRFVYCYLLPEKFGIDKRIITHSALVRTGELTRDEALADLRRPALPPDKMAEDVEYVVRKLGLSREDFDSILQLPAKSFRDYPSYYPLFEKLGTAIRWALKLALPWTPPFVLEMEARKKAGKR